MNVQRMWANLDKIELSNFLCLFILYFVQAMPYGVQSRYLPILMRREGVSLTSLGLYKLLLAPWICKFFISAFLVDVYKTKRFWLFATMLTLSLGSLLAAFFSSFQQLAFIIFVLNWASATQDICVDWFAMNALKKEDLGLGNTIQVGAFKLGTLFSGGLLVYLMDYTTVSSTFLIIAGVYMISLFLLKLSFLNSETNNEHTKANEKNERTILSFKDRIVLLHKSPGTYWICLFVLIYKLGEQSSLNMIPLFLVDHQVSSSKIGLWIGIIGQSLSIFSSVLGGVLLKKTNQKIMTHIWVKYSVICRIVPSVLITLIVSILDNKENQISDSFLLDVLLYLVLVQLFFSGLLTTFTFTLMMEISFLAPKKIQATHFSLLATCEVFGKLLFQPLIAAFTEHYGYSHAFYFFTFLYIICILIVQMKPRKMLLNEINENFD